MLEPVAVGLVLLRDSACVLVDLDDCEDWSCNGGSWKAVRVLDRCLVVVCSLGKAFVWLSPRDIGNDIILGRVSNKVGSTSGHTECLPVNAREHKPSTPYSTYDEL